MSRLRDTRALRVIDRLLPQLGLDVRRMGSAAKALVPVGRDLVRYRRMARVLGQPVPSVLDLAPAFHEGGANAGEASGHYFHQDLWAARLIRERNPTSHIDVGSRIDGFVGHLLVFREVTVVDIRPLPSDIAGLTFVQGDATTLDGFADNTVESISSLHALEHVGLGRYGDELDPTGTVRAIGALARVSAPGGRVYLGIPVGRERTMFNAHRILAPSTVLEAAKPLELVSFSAVDDRGELMADCSPGAVAGADYACGLFELTKRVR